MNTEIVDIDTIIIQDNPTPRLSESSDKITPTSRRDRAAFDGKSDKSSKFSLSNLVGAFKSDPNVESSNSKLSGWASTDGKLSTSSRKQSSFSKTTTSNRNSVAEKAAVAQWSEDNIPSIPDIDDQEPINIAVSPQAILAPPRTIGELEMDIDASNGALNQVQSATIPGLDLSILIQDALCPYQQLDEPDEVWDWDVVMTKLRSEMNSV